MTTPDGSGSSVGRSRERIGEGNLGKRRSPWSLPVPDHRYTRKTEERPYGALTESFPIVTSNLM
jgi:hypothetical protein